MPVYKVAFFVSCLLLVPLAFIQVTMRQQVHDANYGKPEISPWDVRFVNALFGQHGIWSLHKKAYERSALRAWCMALCFAWLASTLVALGGFLLAHR